MLEQLKEVVEVLALTNVVRHRAGHEVGGTEAQWAALEAANRLLLLDGEGDAKTYLPLVLRR